jgi:hypothetical protein
MNSDPIGNTGIAGGLNNILNVAGGQESFKLDVGLVTEDIIYIAVAVFVAILAAYVLGNVILKKL